MNVAFCTEKMIHPPSAVLVSAFSTVCTLITFKRKALGSGRLSAAEFCQPCGMAQQCPLPGEAYVGGSPCTIAYLLSIPFLSAITASLCHLEVSASFHANAEGNCVEGETRVEICPHRS